MQVQLNLQKPLTNIGKYYHTLKITWDCPNKAFGEFIRLYENAFEKAFPLRSVRPNQKFIRREPWVTQGLLTSSRKKARLLVKKLKTPTEHNINYYKTFNQVFDKLKRQLKINYYKLIIEENRFNINKTWSIVKHNDKSSFPKEFIINNKPTSNKRLIAESFNMYFSKIGQETSQNVPASEKSFAEYLSNSVANIMFLEPIDNTTSKLKLRQVLDMTKFQHNYSKKP